MSRIKDVPLLLTIHLEVIIMLDLILIVFYVTLTEITMYHAEKRFGTRYPSRFAGKARVVSSVIISISLCAIARALGALL